MHVCRPGHVGSFPQETVPLGCRNGDGDEAGADGGAGEPGHIDLEPGRSGDERRQHGREERRWRHVARVMLPNYNEGIYAQLPPTKGALKWVEWVAKRRGNGANSEKREREKDREGGNTPQDVSIARCGKRGGRYALFQANPHKQGDLTGNDTILPTRHPANVPRDSGEPYIDCLCMEPYR